MKEIKWDNPNKMHFESYYKTFNRQTNCITTGNVIANTQYSSFIRPFNETECNGFTREPGHLMEYDLKNFEAPNWIKDWIRENVKDRKESCIAYNFHVWDKGKRVDIGFVLTDREHNLIGYRVIYGRNSTNKRESAILEAIKYITN